MRLLDIIPYGQLDSAHPWLFTVLAAVLGACVGSFLNVVIYRLPLGKSVVHPGSACGCGKAIAWYDNIPVLSWLLLRGRARCCGSKFSFRYCGVELLTAGLFALCWVKHEPAVAISGWVMVSCLIAGSFIDFDSMEIPDRFTLGLAVVGVTLSWFIPSLHGFHSGQADFDSARSLAVAMRGLLVGSAIPLWIALMMAAVMKRDTMGMGDVKLLGAIGAFCGWPGAAFALGIGAVIGLAWAVFSYLWKLITGTKSSLTPVAKNAKGEEMEIGRGAEVPFGPSIAIAGVIYFLFARHFIESYLPNL